MKYIIFTGLLLFSFFICKAQNFSENPGTDPDITVVNYNRLKEVLMQENDKLLVVNFWATWCVPCVEELPEFMKVHKKYKDNPDFKMILVSLDRVKSIESVKKFAAKKSITPEIYLLDDNKNMNVWIPAIDSSWSGAIPATVFYKNGTKVFFKEEQMNLEELNTIIQENL